MFEKILVANRGEIALRVIRAAKEMGIRTVAVYSTVDVNALHVRFADEAVCIGPAQATQSYLAIPNVISAAEITGVDAIHPGYGFLAENIAFAKAVRGHGMTFIGPDPEHLGTFGDKLSAKAAAKAAGVPLIPGSEGAVDDEIAILIHKKRRIFRHRYQPETKWIGHILIKHQWQRRFLDCCRNRIAIIGLCGTRKNLDLHK